MRKARNLRKAKGLSLRDVERETGIDYTAIAKFENEDQGLGLANLQKLAGFFGCTIDELLAPAEGPEAVEAA